jgi:hypothetical protein
MPREKLLVSKLPPPQLLDRAGPGKRNYQCWERKTIHDSDRNVPVQTPSWSFDHRNKYILQKVTFCTTKHISEPNIVGSFSKFSKPNKIPGHSRLTRGHWTDPRMRNPRNYSKFRKKYYGGAMRTETVHELQERQSRASLLACFLVLKLKNKTAKRIKVTKM